MTPIAADLHTHTTRSDGTTKPEEITEIAKKRGLKAIAVTDHDQYHDEYYAPLMTEDGVDIISGIELRVRIPKLDERVDLLGYGVTPTAELDEVVDKIQDNRKYRIEQMLDLVEKATGVRPDYEPTRTSGRPHVARAIEDTEELDYTYQEAFDELIGNDCPCYTSRSIPTFDDGLKALKDSCHLVSLAHPYRYKYPRGVLKYAKQLDAVECIYPYGDIADYKTIGLDDTAVDWFDLVMTGGSDAHEPESIGTAGLLEEHYELFLERADLKKHSQHF